MKNNTLIRIISSRFSVLLICLFISLLPISASAQSVEYLGNQGELIGTSDSRMVVTILESSDYVELQVGGIGDIYASVFALSVLYNPSALVLTDSTYSRDIPDGLDPLTLGSVIQRNPQFISSYPRMEIEEAIDHGNVSGCSMKYLNSDVRLGTITPSESMHPVRGVLLPVYSIYFRKQASGVALQSSDLGFYNNTRIPRISSYWSFNSVAVSFSTGGPSDAEYVDQNVFVFRSPSYVTTGSVTDITGCQALLNGTFQRGDLSPASMLVCGQSSSNTSGRLNYDEVVNYGFIYSSSDDTLSVNGITKKLTVNGIDYDFPTPSQLSSSNGIILFGSTTLYFKPFVNSVSDQAVPYSTTINGLRPDTDYYVWSYEQYKFETSDTYLAIGDQVTFRTLPCEEPEAPVSLSSQSFCQSGTISDLVAEVASGSTLSWYDASVDGTQYAPGDALVDGTTYYARAISGACSSTSTAVTVSLNSTLVAPVATSPQTLCSGSFISDLDVTGINIQWYDSPTGGTLLSLSDALVDGSIYYAGQSSSTCQSTTRTAVKVILSESEVPGPVISSPQYFCNSATLSDIATDGSTLVWYSSNGSQLPFNTYLQNGVTYYAARSEGSCESSDRTPVLVYTGGTTIAAPDVASPQHMFTGSTLANIAVPNNQIIWYATSTSTTPLPAGTIVSDGMTYYAAQRAGDCESLSRTPVLILIDGVSGPDISSPQSICGDATLADLSVTGSGIVWYDSPIGGTELPSSTPLPATPTTYYVAQRSDDNVGDRVGVVVSSNPVPVPSVSPIEICIDSNNADNAGSTFDLTGSVTVDPNYTYTYYFDQQGTIITDPSHINTPSSTGVLTYYVKAFDPVTGCESDYVAITVTANPSPEISITPAGGYTSVGGSTTITITDDNTNLSAEARVITIKDPSIADVSLAGGVVTITGKIKGNTEIVYTSTNEYDCISEYTIPVQVEGSPTGILTGKDIIVCNVPGGGDTHTVQIAYIMGGVAPWHVTISDDRGLFTTDTIINSIEELPVNVQVTIPENQLEVPEFTTYFISEIVDNTGASKTTHYGSVRLGTNPTPVVKHIANQTQTVCSGSPTLPISVNGVATTYTFSIDKNVGTVNYTANSVPSFIAMNKGTQADTVKIAIVPEYWYNGIVCIGEPDTAEIIIKPNPVVNPVSNQQLCASAPLAVTFTGSADEYHWTNSEPGIGLPASGTGDINLAAVSNPTKSPIVAIFTVTPKNNTTISDCEGSPVNFTVTILPTTSVNSVADQTLCNNQPTNAIAFSGAVPGTTYRWTNDNTSIGLASSGAGDIASFRPVNNGNTAITATITVTPEYTYGTTTCENTSGSKTFTITVNPAPVEATIFDTIYCAGESVPVISLNPNTIWRQSGNNVGLSTMSGTGDIPSFVSTNTTSQPQTATFEIIPMSGTCEGIPVTYKVTVNPAITLLSATNAGNICSGTNFRYTARSNVSNASFTWTRAAVSDINDNAPSEGTGAEISETLHNTSSDPVEVTYTITMLNGGCSSAHTVTVVVNPAPVLSTLQTLAQACSSSATVELSYALIAAQQSMSVTYDVTFDQSSLLAGFTNVIGESLSGDFITLTLPSSVAPGSYSGTLRFGTDGCMSSTTYPFTIQLMDGVQILTQPVASQRICENESFTLSVTASGANLTYQWYHNGSAIPDAITSTYAASQTGTYSVSVISDCGSVTSTSVDVVTNGLLISQKWNDVVFIPNTSDAYVGYQWYHDGQAIGKNGNYQYYSQDGGLNGTYSVQVRYADGTTQMSCPYTVEGENTHGASAIHIYPNPVQIGKTVVVDLSELSAEESQNAKVFIYDMSGKLMAYSHITNPVEHVVVDVPVAGNYVVRVTTSWGRLQSEKVVVIE